MRFLESGKNSKSKKYVSCLFRSPYNDRASRSIRRNVLRFSVFPFTAIRAAAIAARSSRVIPEDILNFESSWSVAARIRLSRFAAPLAINAKDRMTIEVGNIRGVGSSFAEFVQKFPQYLEGKGKI